MTPMFPRAGLLRLLAGVAADDVCRHVLALNFRQTVGAIRLCPTGGNLNPKCFTVRFKKALLATGKCGL